MKKLMIGAIAVLLPACSSASGSAPTVPEQSAVTSRPTTAEQTTPVPTTIAATTSTIAPPPSTTTSTTVAPTTSIAVDAQIEQAVQDYAAAYHACGVDPASCKPETFTASQGPSRSILVNLVAEMVPNGLHFRPDARGSYVRVESAQIMKQDEAIAIGCVFDAGTVLGPIGPDGLPTVVNDQLLSTRASYLLFKESGRWLVGEKRELQSLGEGDQC